MNKGSWASAPKCVLKNLTKNERSIFVLITRSLRDHNIKIMMHSWTFKLNNHYQSAICAYDLTNRLSVSNTHIVHVQHSSRDSHLKTQANKENKTDFISIEISALHSMTEIISLR